jgi:uncharacterized protein involved in exopolysaccharide biosynthesis
MTPPSIRADPGNGLTFEEFAHAARRTWRSAIVWGAIGLFSAAIAGIVRPKKYTARASFIAEQQRVRSLPTGLGALATQFGLNVGGDGGRSPQFYQDLVQTSGLLLGVLDSVVAIAPGESLSVRRLLRGSADSSRENVDRLLRRLRSRVAVQVDSRTSVVTLMVAQNTPAAAEALSRILIGAIKHFNVATRQLQARELRIFLEKRVVDALQSLHEAEDDLRKFYERNRRIADSPQLMFEESRLKHQVELRQELYTSLSQALESARIDEVNDTPTITIIDPPFAYGRPDGPGILALALIGLVMGVLARGGWLVLTGR